MNRAVKLAKPVAILVLLPALIATAWLWFNQENMIFPAPDISGYELSIPDFSNVDIETGDGETLKMFWHPPEKSEAIILVFHGNGDAAFFQQAKGRSLAEAGFGVLLAEYRGYGGSSGSPTEEGLHLDGLAAYDFVRGKTDLPIGIYAHSLGSGVATQLALKREIFALVLEAPFDSLQAVAQDAIPWLPVGLLLKHPFRSDERIADIEVPMLIMHGNRDRVVPLKHGKRLAQLASDATLFIEIDGAGHNDLTRFGTIEKAIAFLRQAIPK